MTQNPHDGWRMPAEWAPQAATWLAWPANPDTWPGHLRAAQAEFIAFAETIAQFQPVRILVNSSYAAEANALAARTPNIQLVEIPTNDAWVRDHGPTFVLSANDQKLGAVDWQYNAWGGKYPPFDLDQQVAKHITRHLGCEHLPSFLCLEGGALEVNGDGLLMTTRSCVLNPNRNPDQSCETIETELKRKLGVDTILWLPGDAVPGDDTDGHIDQWGRFVSPAEIVYCWCDDPADPRYPAQERNLAALQEQLALAELSLTLTPLSLPTPRIVDGQTLPASYANFLILNDAVIAPQFGAPEDACALDVLRDRFPTREVIGRPSRWLVVGLGSFHCLSQQQPLVA